MYGSGSKLIDGPQPVLNELFGRELPIRAWGFPRQRGQAQEEFKHDNFSYWWNGARGFAALAAFRRCGRELPLARTAGKEVPAGGQVSATPTPGGLAWDGTH